MPSPPSTRTIGYGTEMASARRTSTIAAATSAIRISMSFTPRVYDRREPPLTQLTPPISAEDHVDGPDRAELELGMYGDFHSPYCPAAFPIVHRIRDQPAARLLFAFRHFQLRQVHPDAQRAAEAGEAAAA